jgi:hypothetical protein
MDCIASALEGEQSVYHDKYVDIVDRVSRECFGARWKFPYCCKSLRLFALCNISPRAVGCVEYLHDSTYSGGGSSG